MNDYSTEFLQLLGMLMYPRHEGLNEFADRIPLLGAMRDCVQDPRHHPEGWLLREIPEMEFSMPFQTSLTGTTQAERINHGFSLRQLLTSTMANSTSIPSSSSATPTVSLNASSATDGEVALPTAIDPLFSLMSITIPTQSESFMWEIRSSTSRTGPVIRVVFQVPLAGMHSIMNGLMNDFEIIERVIQFISVPMVNMFPTFEPTSEVQTHQEAMQGNWRRVTRPREVQVTSGWCWYDPTPNAVDNNVHFMVDLFLEGNINSAHVDYDTTSRLFHLDIGDTWDHTCCVVQEAASIVNAPMFLSWTQDWSAQDEIVLGLAALFHDCGKPATTTWQNEKITSYGHDRVGSELAYEYLIQQGCPTDIAERVRILIDLHMRRARGGMPTRRMAARLLRDLGPVSLKLWAALCVADIKGRPPRDPEPGIREIEQWIAMAEQAQQMPTLPTLPIRGADVLERGILEGPLVGRILSLAEDAHERSPFATRAEALGWLDAYLDRIPKLPDSGT